jgi:predicted transposase YdaD
MKDPVVHDPHDKFFKESFGRKELVVPFLQRVLPESLCAEMAWESVELEAGSFLDEALTLRSSDLLFSAKWSGKDALLYCLFEHQSTPDGLMPLRLLRYMVRIWDRWLQGHEGAPKLPLIIPVVLYQGLGGWTAAPDLRALVDVPEAVGPAWESYVPTFCYRVVDAHDEAEQKRLEGLVVGHLLSLLASVMLTKDEERLSQAFAAIQRMFASGDDLGHVRTALQYLFTTSGDVDRTAFTRHIKALKDTTLQEQTMSIAEQLRAEGIEQGIERGLDQGLARGLQSSVIEVLQTRFGRVPEGLQDSVRMVSDQKTLHAYLRAATTCEGIEPFTRSM